MRRPGRLLYEEITAALVRIAQESRRDPATIQSVAGLRLRFCFTGELNDFLSAERRNPEFKHMAGATDTVKHVIESLGVPHTEVGRVLANGEPRALSDPLRDGDAVQVFPHKTPVHLECEPKFVVDGHLGRLAAYLRMLGLDTWYGRLADDALLASVSHNESRILLTRDVGLLKRRDVKQGYCVRSDKPHDQLHEMTHRFVLQRYFTPFTRCMDCNGPLSAVAKSEVTDLLPPHTRETKNEFSRCDDCRKILWRGSHRARMLQLIESLANDSPIARFKPPSIPD